MAEQALSTPAQTPAKRQSARRKESALLPRLVTGAVILGSAS